MKIVADKNIPFVQEAFSTFGEVVIASGREINREIIADAEILLVRSVTLVTEELLAGSSIKFVATATIGTEHIDRVYLDKKRIGFAYAPGSNANSVAEYVVAAILLMARKTGRRPSDMVLGIVGVGNIGSRLHAYAEALGMKCLLNDPPKRRRLGSCDDKSSMDAYRSIEDLLECSDIISLHVPLVKDGPDPTWHLINDSFLQRLKQGAVLVNTSRGKTMSDESLIKYHPKLGALVLDVWNNEPRIDPSICELADIATPHIAGYSFDGKINGAGLIYQAACSFFGRQVLWDFRNILAEQGDKIDCTGSSDPVGDAAINTVPILRDSLSLKKICLMADNEQGTYFDSLRATYPKRLEFPHFSVVCGKNEIREAVILSKLGFKIANEKAGLS